MTDLKTKNRRRHTFVLLGLGNHVLDLLLGETTLVVGDGDTVRLAGGPVGGRDVEDTVSIDTESDLDLSNTTRSRGNARELELAEEVVVLDPGTLTLVELNQDTRLVVGVGREDLRLLSGDDGVTLDESGHDTTRGLNTEGKRDDIEEEGFGLVRGVARENGGLDSGTISDSLIKVEELARFLAVEEVGDNLDDTENTSGTTDEGNFVNVGLVDP